MKNNKIFGVKLIAFIIIIAAVISQVNWILTPKKYYDNDWPTTTTYKGFYKIEKNTVDVLFLGSSHAVTAFNPQVIYNNYGIKSYNIGCEQQNLLTSYYWLQEALRYQNPKVVVLDTYMLFSYRPDQALNTAESCTRMAFDAMKWSSVKWNAVKDICRIDSNQSFNSYLLTNIRFHARWTELTENDLTYLSKEKHYELKGYAPFNNKCANYDYAPYKSDHDQTTYCETVSVMQEYLGKIIELCKNKDIKIILVKTPTTQWSIDKHNTVQKYADDVGVEFWDFNEQDIYEATGLDFPQDMTDNEHGNVWGAEKMSAYIGKKIQIDYGISSSSNGVEQWEDTDSYYQTVYEDSKLRYITELDEYVTAINHDRYTIFISSLNDVNYLLNDDVKKLFKTLGLNMNVETSQSYYAVIEQGRVTECVGNGDIVYNQSINNHLIDFTITAGDSSSIMIETTEYSRAQQGLNIVVYSNERRIIVDRVTYNGAIVR